MPRLGLGSFGMRRLSGRFWGASRVNRTAVLAGLLWAVLVLSYAGGYLVGGGGSQARGTAFLDAVFFVVALVLPLGLIGLAAWLAAELARQREAVAALVAAAGPLTEALAETRSALAQEGPLTARELDRVLRGALGEAQAELGRDLDGAIERRIGHLGEGQRRIETLLSSHSARPAAPAGVQNGARRGAAPAARAGGEATGQPELPSMPVEPAEELGWEEFLRALDFPKDPDDREGFTALRRALRHHNLAQMLQAAEDVLNLLSQEGVYVDDLEHEPGPPETWRAFAEGKRGPEMDGVGGIRDPNALEVVRRLMKADGVFRDTALFFQRRFDGVLSEVAPKVEDQALVALADTRSGRAFMLCARASGSFG